MSNSFEKELSWIKTQMKRTSRCLDRFFSLESARIAFDVHLDLKLGFFVAQLIDRGANVFLTTCNPKTVRPEVADFLRKKGAIVCADRQMSEKEHMDSFNKAIEWEPTHLCEMGADISCALLKDYRANGIRAGLEGTGSGISKIRNMQPSYPIFNWDDLPIKEGLHNRHMVGLCTWQAFFEKTKLSLHEKSVLVVGYGLVGCGVAQTARAFGGQVFVCELDKSKALEAAYAGYEVVSLEEGLLRADVIVTATGVRNVIEEKHFAQLKRGAFLLNVGHAANEIEVGALPKSSIKEILPFVEEIRVDNKHFYLLAQGSMFNLTAGHGDSLNAFDITLAAMGAGLIHILSEGQKQTPGLHLLPKKAWIDFI